MTLEFYFRNGAFSCLRNGFGWKNIVFECNGTLSTDAEWTCEPGQATVDFRDRRETLTFENLPEHHAVIVRRRIRNISGSPLCLNTVSDGSRFACGDLLPHEIMQKLLYMHSSNLRVERFPETRSVYPYIRPLPEPKIRFNHGEGNDVPAWGLFTDDYAHALIEGDLSQRRFTRSWELGLEDYQGIMDYTMSENFMLLSDEEVEVSAVWYQILEQIQPQYMLDGYTKTAARTRNLGQFVAPLLHHAVYCTWNYGVFENISEEIILKRAQILHREIPDCTHFLIDDGYQKNSNGLCNFYPDPANAFDDRKFPHGMKFIADQLRETGFTPGLWLSPKIYLDSRLAREKPDWLLRDAAGNASLIGDSTFLDLGHPEARDFVLRVLDTLYLDWGFKGIKFDFMSQWFLLARGRFSAGSGLEWRDFIFREIRRRIGPDGIFMTCIAMSMGNPLQGVYPNCYRCGRDIHLGAWHEQLLACRSTLPQLLQQGRQTLLLNMDSIGIGDCPEHETIFRFNWVFITQGIFELGGPLENLSDSDFELFRKILANMDRGHKVHCPDEEAFYNTGFPRTLYVDYPRESVMYQQGVRRHIALFNWSDEPAAAYIPAGHKAAIVDFWGGEPVNAASVIELPPRSSRLLIEQNEFLR